MHRHRCRRLLFIFVLMLVFSNTGAAFAEAIPINEALAEVASAEEALPEADDLVVLVNCSYPVNKEYLPKNTFVVSDYMPSYKKIVMQEEAGRQLINMYEAMKADGIYNLKAISGYRTYNEQSKLFTKEVKYYSTSKRTYEEAYNIAKTIVTPAGTSEHQTGLAIDLSINSSLSGSFSKTTAGKWLADNSYKYGFILRYPENKTDVTGIIFEPWHFRYVGLPHSQIIYENGWCLEEYVEHLKAGGIRLNEEYFVYDVEYEESLDNPQELFSFSKDNTGGYIVTRYYENLEPQDTEAAEGFFSRLIHRFF